MKIALLGDTHFGARGDSQHFHAFFEKFYSEIFFPYLKRNNIQVVLQLGDIFDRRKYSNHYTLDEAKRYFFSQFEPNGVNLITLLGNHDLFYRESLSVSSSELFLTQFKNVEIIKQPTQIKSLDISVIPWICKENYDECVNFIKNDTSRICVGHFEISGFKMYENSILSEHGLSADLFSKYENVYSGHYHHKSKRGNIEYIGTPYEMNWQDYGDQKGFHVFDLETREKEFIENPFSIYIKVPWDDSGIRDVTSSTYFEEEFLSEFENKYVKINVEQKNNPYWFDLFVDQINSRNPIDVSIIENIVDLEIDETIDETDDTLTITYKYIESLNQQDFDNIKLKKIMSDLYNEAMAIE